MTAWFTMTPHDTLFFRDGRPFNQDDEGLNDAASMFPPPHGVLIGALRAAVAAGAGFDPTINDWANDPVLGPLLGNGPDDLGMLSFRLPVPAIGDSAAPTLGFVPPRHLFAPKTGDCTGAYHLGQPIDQTLMSDIGEIRLAAPVPRGFGPRADRLIDSDGMNDVLAGKPPRSKHLFASDKLWHEESRIGLAIDQTKRTAKASELYQAGHIRLTNDCRLVIGVDGLPRTHKPNNPWPLGGMQRLVDIERLADAPSCPQNQLAAIRKTNGVWRYIVVLLTPAHLPDPGWARPGACLGQKLPGKVDIPGKVDLAGKVDLPGKVVLGFCDRSQWIGGWDSRKGPKGERFIGPIPLKPYLPAGSVWFIEAGQDELDNPMNHAWPTAIGDHQHAGYGAIAIGGWPISNDEKQREPHRA